MAKMNFELSPKMVVTLKKRAKEIVDESIDEIREKIAFSLFTMYYYRFRFLRSNDKYLNKIVLKEIGEIWKLGKMKKKLKRFFDLADQVLEINFDNNSVSNIKDKEWKEK